MSVPSMLPAPSWTLWLKPSPWLSMLGMARRQRIGVIRERSLRRRPRTLALVLTLWAPLLVAAKSPGLRSLPLATIPEGLGVNIHFTDPRPGELEMIARAGFRWVRMDFTWSATERMRGQYDFGVYERLLTALADHKQRAVFILDYSNRLYEADHSVATETGGRAFARWAAAAAAHFKDRGILWEIWNEPNIRNFWKPQPDPVQYTALALAAAQAIRESAPGELIIGPASSTVDLPFLEACFQAGLLQWWDAVSVHPYRQRDPETAGMDYLQLRRLIARYAPKGKTIPILSGEWGFSAAWPGYDAEAQGRLLARQWLTNLAHYVPLSIWYDWHDDGTDPREPEHHFGTVAFAFHPGWVPVYDPKPAYLAAKTLTEVLGGFEFVKRIATGNQDDYVLLFRKGDAMRVAIWTTETKRHEIRIPSGACTFEVVEHIGRPAGSGESHAARLAANRGGFVTVTASGSPRYLIVQAANRELAGARAFHPLAISLVQAGGMLTVKVENLSEAAFQGKARLVDVEGIQPATREQPLAFVPGERVKIVRFRLASKSRSAYRIGLKVEDEGGVTMLSQPAQRFVPLAANSLEGCMVIPDGDSKVGSAHSLVVSRAPEPLPDPDLPVVN